jgi:hypothetical protein
VGIASTIFANRVLLPPGYFHSTCDCRVLENKSRRNCAS